MLRANKDDDKMEIQIKGMVNDILLEYAALTRDIVAGLRDGAVVKGDADSLIRDLVEMALKENKTEDVTPLKHMPCSVMIRVPGKRG